LTPQPMPSSTGWAPKFSPIPCRNIFASQMVWWAI